MIFVVVLCRFLQEKFDRGREDEDEKERGWVFFFDLEWENACVLVPFSHKTVQE